MTQGLSENVKIIPISEEYIDSFYECLDSVVKERRYLAGVESPPIESTREFVLSNIRNNIPQFVALDGNRVVGWCDIRPNKGVDFAHCGVLGMGVHRAYRRQGIGTVILDTTIKAARTFGLEKVELEVYTSNNAAIMLYEKFGFTPEGIKKKARKLDGEYFDIMLMALFL